MLVLCDKEKGMWSGERHDHVPEALSKRCEAAQILGNPAGVRHCSPRSDVQAPVAAASPADSQAFTDGVTF
jgi:hypothetical protein